MQFTKEKHRLSVIFDLDGTLIDSSNSILKSVEIALGVCGHTPKVDLNNELIGPPLIEMLKVVSGVSSSEVLEQLAGEFKDAYDTQGYKNTEVFDGATTLLDCLFQRRLDLYIATNKRIYPTKKIIEYLNWGSYFTGYYSLDSFEHVSDKAELIAEIMDRHNLSETNTLYVGDTVSDLNAASKNNLDCILVSWGYGDLAGHCGSSVCDFHSLQNLIVNYSSS